MPLIRFIHPEGWRFIAIFAAVTLLFYFLRWTSLAWIGLILTTWCAYFFRTPARMTPTRPGLVISPADGKVVIVNHVLPPETLGLGTEECVRISIFLNIFDVHANRIPISGTVKDVIYHSGKFFNASLDKASEHNERNFVSVETENGRLIGFTQIAGLIARRIRCDIESGDKVEKGQIYGIIRFGSRMDIYLPFGVNPLVIVGQRTIAGETVLADLDSDEPAREGEMR